MRTLKLQFWSFDIVLAIVIFTVAMTLLAFEWSSIEGQLSLSYSNNAEMMQLQSETLSRSLFYTGWPLNWESTVNSSNSLTWGLISIGLGTGNGTQISQGKLAALWSIANSNYQTTKQLLGVSYNYYIQLRNNNVNIGIGRNPSQYGAVTVYSSSASGYLDGSPVLMKVIIWTNTSYGEGT